MRPQKKARWGHRHEELDGGEAFVHDPRHGFVAAEDGDTEAFGEEFVASATSNEPVSELARDEEPDGDIDIVAIDLDDDELD
jgi:hypothetical protein